MLSHSGESLNQAGSPVRMLSHSGETSGPVGEHWCKTAEAILQGDRLFASKLASSPCGVFSHFEGAVWSCHSARQAAADISTQ